MSKALDFYYALTETFVNWDTTKINTSLAELKISVDSLRIHEMEKDSAMQDSGCVPVIKARQERCFGGRTKVLHGFILHR